MSTALQQVERIARSSRCAVTSDAHRIVAEDCRALGFALNPTRSEIATVRGFRDTLASRILE